MDPLGFGFDSYMFLPFASLSFPLPLTLLSWLLSAWRLLQRLLHTVDSAPGWLCCLHSWVANFIEITINLFLPLLLHEHKIC